ncbi:MAG: hypothetical protein L3J98_17675 [Gammaproteobacteria bacterium]|nr:hypothetical protein [Gammaproteobacteria bacterium]MCF6261954.1 hypothetical protein [Gammaproteobacteria bacterium]
MSKFISISAAFATVAGIGVSGYMMGQSNASDSTDVIKIIITNAISDLPENKQGPATDLLRPILELATAQQNGMLDDDNSFTQYENKLKENLEKITLTSYQAGKSPFIPPKKMTQFLCGDQFRFSYKGLRNRSDVEKIRYTVEGNLYALGIGEPKKFHKDGKTLEIAYLSFSEEQDGPVLQYICSGR